MKSIIVRDIARIHKTLKRHGQVRMAIQVDDEENVTLLTEVDHPNGLVASTLLLDRYHIAMTRAVSGYIRGFEAALDQKELDIEGLDAD